MKTLFATKIGNTRVSLEWKLADLWIGAFYAQKGSVFNLWVCVFPCLPIHVEVSR